MRAKVLSAAALAGAAALVISAVPASADMFPPSKFPLTSYSMCTIDGDRVSLSMSYRVSKKDSSMREVDKVYLSGPLVNASVSGKLVDARSGKKIRGKQTAVYRGFSTQVAFNTAQVSPGSIAKVKVRTAAGSCTATLRAE